MAKKGENIYKRKDQRWEGRYIKEYDPAGKARFGYVYGKTYRETRIKLLERKAAVQTEAPVRKPAAHDVLAVYAQEWLTLCRNRVKDSTYVKYHNLLKNHIEPWLGNDRPTDLTTIRIEAFSHSLLTRGSCKSSEGLAPKTVKDILMVLRSILNYTRKRLGNACPEVEIVYPKEHKQEMRVLSLEEQQRLIRYLLAQEDNCRLGVLLALLTGLRIGELCALRWKDISLGERTLRVNATMQRLQILEPVAPSRSEVVIREPKSATSCRQIPLTAYAAELCTRLQVSDPEAFILTGRPDRFMEPRTLQYRLAGYTKACGLRGVHFHTLRHTFATRCVEVGFEVKSLSEILGHSSVKVTLDRYVHASMELKRDNMQKLAAIGF